MPDITRPASAGTIDGKVSTGPSTLGRNYGTWTDADGRPVALRMAGSAPGRLKRRWAPSWMLGWRGLVFYPVATAGWFEAYASLGWLWMAGLGLAFAGVAVGQVAAVVYAVRCRPARTRRLTYRALASAMWVWGDISATLMVLFSWLVLPGQLTGPALVQRIVLVIMVVGTVIDLRVAVSYRRWRPW